MNVIELRSVLTEQLTKLKSGKGDVKTANAMVNASARIMASVKLEMDYAKMHSEKADIEFMKPAKTRRAT